MEGNRGEKWRSDWTHDDFEKYGGQYVAIKDRYVVANAKTLEELEQKLDVIRTGKVIIEFIEDPKVVVIYGIL